MSGSGSAPRPLADVPIVEHPPRGYHWLGYFRGRETDRAALFDYHGWELWIPKKTLRFSQGHYAAPGWAIDSSKKFQMERRP